MDIRMPDYKMNKEKALSQLDKLLKNQDIEDNTTIEFCRVYKYLQTLQLSHLKTMITYPAFVENLYKMYVEFVKYEIDMNAKRSFYGIFQL